MELRKESYLINEILAVLVIYNCPLKDSATFNSLKTSLQKSNMKLDVLIYDNSSERQVEKEHDEQWDVHYIHDPENPGVSRAYNVGYNLALQLKKKWILLLDQDTNFPENSIEIYLNALRVFRKIPVMAPRLSSNQKYLSPCSRFPRPSLRINTLESGEYSLKNIYLLNSGLLVKTQTFGFSGGYNEAIKLDFSDFAFLHRLKKHVRSFLLLEITAEHGFFANENKSVEQLVERFKYYSEGALHMFKETGNFFYRILIILRGFKLALKYRHMAFLKYIFWQSDNIGPE